MNKNISYDNEAQFFNDYLKKYMKSDEEYIKCFDRDNELFNIFSKNHKKFFGEKNFSFDNYLGHFDNEDDKLANCYMFYVASGVIIPEQNIYYINREKLDIMNQYFELIEDLIKEKETSLKKVKK